jgi:ORF6N domain
MKIPSQRSIIPSAFISPKIFFVRGTKVMLDADLSRLYGVETKNLNKAVKRNANRFLSISCFSFPPRNYSF